MVGDALISGKDISYTYPDGTLGFSTLSLEISRGEKVALLGPNGCGKSTLMLVLSGLLKPTTGTVLIDGQRVEDVIDTIRRRVGFVFQDPDIFLFNPTVEDELKYALLQLGYSQREIEERVSRYAREFGLESVLKKPPFRLSGGEKKRVEIASVLIYEPEILFLDEPTANVDGKTRRKVIEILREYEGTMVLSTHEMDIAEKLADRVVVMSLEKKIVYDGGKEVLEDRSFLEEVGVL
ncbi:energy-coupling factor ABC transporter ATP-binding protein [Geoglobus ahangari]